MFIDTSLTGPSAPSAEADVATADASLSISIKGRSLDSSFVMTPGQQVKAAVFLVSSDGSRSDVSEDVEWGSDDSRVVAVEGGVIVARSAGTATLSASYRGMTPQFKVTVNPSDPESGNAGTDDRSGSEGTGGGGTGGNTGSSGGGIGDGGDPATVTQLSISGTGTLPLSSSTQLQATATMSNGSQRNMTTSATWSSSQPDVASVSGGLVTSIGQGSAIITVEHGGQTSQMELQVSPEELPPPPVPVPPLPPLPQALPIDSTFEQPLGRDDH